MLFGTSGYPDLSRKQPRFRDVDVEGADDADDDVASQLVAHVSLPPPPTLSPLTLISPYVTVAWRSPV